MLIPTRDNLDQFAKAPMKPSRRWMSPDVVSLTAPCGTRMVLKDYRACPLPVRLTWGRFVASREAAAYERLTGIKGIPRLITRMDSYAFVVELMDAEQLPRRKHRDMLGQHFFERLESVVAAMHERGVAHGDLRRHNILVSEDAYPCLIDFETAVSTYHPFPICLLFRMVKRIDCITILKIKSRYYPERVTETDRNTLSHIPALLRIGRFIRQRIYGPLSRKGARQRRKRAKQKAA